jgi:hypothetical protein
MEDKMQSIFKRGIDFFLPAILMLGTIFLTSCPTENDQPECPEPNLSEVSEDHLVNFEDFTSGGKAKSPLFVTWGPVKRILQVYSNGITILDTALCPGYEISLSSGLYEFKLWRVNKSIPEASLWVDVVNEDSMLIYKGNQFNDEWITVPGDGCRPMITGYQEKYAKYVSADNSNPSYSQLVADAAALKADSEGEEDEKHIIHNITYLSRADSKISAGAHTASYNFQIPSFTTGKTVEGGLFIWLGGEDVRLDFGTAFQLIIDEEDANYGKLYYWGGDNWIDSGKRVEMFRDFEYKVTFTVELERYDATIQFEGLNESFMFSDILSQTVKDETWSVDTVARFQAECISKDSIKHVVNFNDILWHQNL